MGIPVETLRDYINSFKYGAYPHGGCALGLERVVFLYFGLGNIRNAALFPRDPIRLTP
jgi:aspartyl/asparaginyl-tRNA synthetase